MDAPNFAGVRQTISGFFLFVRHHCRAPWQSRYRMVRLVSHSGSSTGDGMPSLAGVQGTAPDRQVPVAFHRLFGSIPPRPREPFFARIVRRRHLYAEPVLALRCGQGKGSCWQIGNVDRHPGRLSRTQSRSALWHFSSRRSITPSSIGKAGTFQGRQLRLYST